MSNPYIVDYSADWEYVDGIESITLTPQNPTATAIEDIQAVRSTIDMKEVQTLQGLGVSPEDILFVIYLATTGDTITYPKTQDKIQDANGVNYVVVAVRTLADIGQARTFCRESQS